MKAWMSFVDVTMSSDMAEHLSFMDYDASCNNSGALRIQYCLLRESV